MNNPNLPTETLEQELIIRYKERLKNVFKTPNPIINNPLNEYREIKSWIEKLQKIKTNK